MAELRQLRRLIGDKTGDVLVLRSTRDEPGADSFTDFAHLGDRGNRAPSIVNRIIYFSDGQPVNWGHEAAVTDFTSLTRTLTFSPAAAAAPAVGDVAELWSVADRIGAVSAIHRGINYAISQVADVAGLEVYAEPSEFTQRDGYLAVPETWAVFGGAEWLDSRDFPSEVRSRYLKVIPGQRLVRLWGMGAQRANRRQVRLYGYERCTPLVA